MNADQIKYMVDRFLMWPLPRNFTPDDGISYKRPNYAPNVPGPSGTNLLDATQAAAMVRHMVDGLPTVNSHATITHGVDEMTTLSDAFAGAWLYRIGDPVEKRSGSSWRGKVCGYYWTELTPRGYCVESAFERGSVQIYPEAALRKWEPSKGE